MSKIKEQKEYLIKEILNRFTEEDGADVKSDLYQKTKAFMHAQLRSGGLPTATSYCDAFALGLMSSIAFWEKNKADKDLYERMLKYAAGSALWYVKIEQDAHSKKVEFIEKTGVLPRAAGRATKIKSKEEEDY